MQSNQYFTQWFRSYMSIVADFRMIGTSAGRDRNSFPGMIKYERIIQRRSETEERCKESSDCLDALSGLLGAESV